MTILRIGCIGAKAPGEGIGGVRVKAVMDNPRTELVAVSRLPADECARLADQLGVAGHADYREMLVRDDIDALIISIPNRLHYAAAKAALEAGKHVCVEYPLCDRLEEYDDLVNTAKSRNRVLHHAFTVRREFCYLALKEGAPKIGDIVWGQGAFFGGGGWYRREDTRGNMWTAMHSHFIDYLEGIFGAPVAWLQAFQRPCDPADDPQDWFGEVVMGFQGSPALASVVFGASNTNPPWRMTIWGTEGSMEGDHERMIFYEKDGSKRERQSQVEWPPFREDLENFVAQVIDAAPAEPPLEHGRRLLDICLKCGESAKTGQRIWL